MRPWREAVIKAILSGDRSGEIADLPIPALDGQVVVTKTLNFSGTASLADHDWKIEQDQDPEIGPVFRFLRGKGEDPAGISAAKTIWRNKKKPGPEKGTPVQESAFTWCGGRNFSVCSSLEF